MKPIYFILLLLINTACAAQTKGEIKFEKDLSWVGIKEKASEENKFIFMDTYTTWCAPCKYMTNYIFSQTQVGDFFNRNFINVAVQIDSTKKDNKYVKSWYKDAKMISDFYKIDAFPTYLFFNQDGILVHVIRGASDSANDFISKVKKVFDPKTQILFLKNEYENGKRDSVFLLALINAAKDANDVSLPVFINTYLATQNNLLTPQNLNFIAQATKKSEDIGFQVLLNHPKEVDVVIGKVKRIKILREIAFDEQIYPLLCLSGNIIRRGEMTMYKTDSLKNNVNWTDIENKIAPEYKDLTKQIILTAKPRYYMWLKDWSNLNKCLLSYINNNNENDIDMDFINSNAWEFSTLCNEKTDLKDAITWSSVIVKNETHPYYFRTYSRLLYKAGDEESAIKYMEKCESLLKKPNKTVDELLEKMRKGEDIK